MEWLPDFSTSLKQRGSPEELADIKPVVPQTLLSKYPDDISASVSVTISHNYTDASHEEVANIKRWADDNQLKVEVVVSICYHMQGKITEC